MVSVGGREIRAVRAREIIDCRGLPTVQVDVVLADGSTGRADVRISSAPQRRQA